MESVARQREDNNVTLAAHVARARPNAPVHFIARDVVALAKIARELRAISTRQCNGYRVEAHERRDHTRQECLRARVLALATETLGVAAVEFNGDPRGAPIHLMASFLPRNGMGDGYAVF